MNHIYRKCSCEEPHCPICYGGLLECIVCGAFEGSLTSFCCGRKMTEDEQDLVHRGDLDYQGQWVSPLDAHEANADLP